MKPACVATTRRAATSVAAGSANVNAFAAMDVQKIAAAPSKVRAVVGRTGKLQSMNWTGRKAVILLVDRSICVKDETGVSLFRVLVQTTNELCGRATTPVGKFKNAFTAATIVAVKVVCLDVVAAAMPTQTTLVNAGWHDK